MILKTDIITTVQRRAWSEATIMTCGLKLMTEELIQTNDTHILLQIEDKKRAEILQHIYGDLLPLTRQIRELEFPTHMLAPLDKILNQIIRGIRGEPMKQLSYNDLFK